MISNQTIFISFFCSYICCVQKLIHQKTLYTYHAFHIFDNLNSIQYTIMLSNGKCCKYLSLLRTKMVWHELSTYTKTNFPTGIKSQILTIYYTYNIAITMWIKCSDIGFLLNSKIVAIKEKDFERYNICFNQMHVTLENMYALSSA